MLFDNVIYLVLSIKWDYVVKIRNRNKNLNRNHQLILYKNFSFDDINRTESNLSPSALVVSICPCGAMTF